MRRERGRECVCLVWKCLVQEEGGASWCRVSLCVSVCLYVCACVSFVCMRFVCCVCVCVCVWCKRLV